MVARFHYDDAVYRSFLDDKLSSQEQPRVNSHIETCEMCQQKLEAISESDLSWDDVQRFLGRSETERPSAIKPTRADVRGIQGHSDRGDSIRFLGETTVPDSLGSFGRYEIMEVLGRGGMGIVLRGYDPALNRHSAIKVLAPELATHAAARQRFSREAKSAAAVVHEHVVPIQTVDEHEGLPYFVMPVVEGRSLAERCEQRGPLETKEVLRIGMQVASELAAAHAQGLVHRDVKPANILLENGVERVMITDFGLARAVDDANMTRSSVIAGTPQYMSPEQARGAEIDHRSDLFSLGSVLYFMSTGRAPFRAETTMGVLNRIVNDQPRPVCSVNPDVPEWLQSVIMRLLAKDPNDRYQTAEEVAEDLGNWLAHVQQPSKVPPPRKADVGGRFSGSGFGGWIVGGIGLAFFFFASLFIFLEFSKGTLTIESEQDDIVVRVVQGEEVVDRLKLRHGKGQTRVRAGEYSVEIEGKHDGMEVKNGRVLLTRGGKVVVTITASRPVAGDSPKKPSLRSYKSSSKANDPITDDVPPRDANQLSLEFDRPNGMVIQVLSVAGDWSERWQSPLESIVPTQLRLICDRVYHIACRNVPGSGDDPVPMVIETRPLTDRTRKILGTSPLAISITADDIAQITAGNPITKVIYAADPPFGQGERNEAADIVQTIVSSRLDPGIDPYTEADRRGTVLAAVRIGGDIPGFDVPEGEPVLDAIREFNREQIKRHPKHGQPELTDQELIGSVMWELRETRLERTAARTAGLKMIAEKRRIPEGWSIVGGPQEFSKYGETISGWMIAIADDQGDSNHVLVVRQRFLKPPQAFMEKGPDSADIDPDGMPLAAAIRQFNASHRQLDGKPQPPLTEEEVIAAILHWKQRRSEAPVVNKDFDAFQRIAETRMLPKDTAFEMIGHFEPGDGATYSIFSVRIITPKSDRKGWTFAYTIRDQFIAVSKLSEGQIHWGKPASNGLQVGVRFLPDNEEYAIGQEIGVEFHFRAVLGKPLSGGLPNMMSSQGIEVLDSAGNSIPTDNSGIAMIAGWRTATFGERGISTRGPSIRIRPLAGLLGESETSDRIEQATNDTLIYVDPGQSIRVRFNVSNYADNSDEKLTTGDVVFRIAD